MDYEGRVSRKDELRATTSRTTFSAPLSFSGRFFNRLKESDIDNVSFLRVHNVLVVNCLSVILFAGPPACLSVTKISKKKKKD